MKTKILKSVFSFAAVAFAVFAAFAFSTSENSDVVDVWGHNPLDDCDVTSVLCQTQESNQTCKTTAGVDLFGMSSETDCIIELYRKVTP